MGIYTGIVLLYKNCYYVFVVMLLIKNKLKNKQCFLYFYILHVCSNFCDMNPLRKNVHVYMYFTGSLVRV